MCHCHYVAQTDLRDEEKSRCSTRDGFHVVFVLVAVVTNQQIVEDAHHARQEQEEEDSFSKHVPWGATKKNSKRYFTNVCETADYN